MFCVDVKMILTASMQSWNIQPMETQSLQHPMHKNDMMKEIELARNLIVIGCCIVLNEWTANHIPVSTLLAQSIRE